MYFYKKKFKKKRERERNFSSSSSGYIKKFKKYILKNIIII